MLMNSQLDPFGQVLRKLSLLKPWQSGEPLQGQCCTRALFQDNTARKLLYSKLTPLIEVILSIIEFARLELRIVDGLNSCDSSSQWVEGVPNALGPHPH